MLISRNNSRLQSCWKAEDLNIQKRLNAFHPPEQKASVLAEALSARGPSASQGAPLHLDFGSNSYHVLKTNCLLFLYSLGLYSIVLCLTTVKGTWHKEAELFCDPLRTGTMSLGSGKAWSLWSVEVSCTAEPTAGDVFVDNLSLPAFCASVRSMLSCASRGSDGSCHRYLAKHPFRESECWQMVLNWQP